MAYGFPLGEPPPDDVEAAAALLLRYEREAPLADERGAEFLQMCADPEAVLKRFVELGGTVED